MIRNLGRIKDFGEGGPADPVSTSISSPVSPRSLGDIDPRKSFKIEVLRNGISGILKPSQRVGRSHFFNLGRSTDPPSPYQPPSRSIPGNQKEHCSNKR